MDKEQFELNLNKRGDTAYLRIPRKATSQIREVQKNIRMHTLLPEYTGPDVIFDFDAQGQLMGIEILLE